MGDAFAGFIIGVVVMCILGGVGIEYTRDKVCKEVFVNAPYAQVPICEAWKKEVMDQLK